MAIQPFSAHPRRWALLALCAGVALTHAWLLWPQQVQPALQQAQGRTPAVSLRLLPASTQASEVAVPVAVQPRPATPQPHRQRKLRAQAVAKALPAPLLDTAPEAPGAAPSLQALPTYATALPPPQRLRYAVRRGEREGEADLLWLPENGRYRMALNSELLGRQAQGRHSEGELDAAGLAPQRYTERRRERELRAANFEREAGRIRFSGPTHELPLPAGAQDRLSWWVQVPAIVRAQPQRFAAGEAVEVFVAGARGDGEVWRFEVLGLQALPAGPALHLQRRPSRPYDTQVDVWLAPEREHLPVRVHLTWLPRGERIEFDLRELSTAP